MLFTDSFNPLIVCRLSKQVHRYHSARAQLALLFDNSNRFFQLIRVKIEGALVHIHKDRGSAFKGNDLRAGKEGEIRYKDRISFFDVPSHHHKAERIGPVAAGDAVFDPYILCQLFLQLCHLFAADKVGIMEHLLDCRVHLRLQLLILLFKSRNSIKASSPFPC